MQDLIGILINVFSFGGGALFVLILFIYLFIRYPEKLERFVSLIMKVFAYFSKKAEKIRITSYINSSVEKSRKHYENTIPGVMPFGFRVSFIDIENPEIYKKQNMLILKMKNHRNDSKNLAYATTYYISSGLLPYSRGYLKHSVCKSIDYVTIKNFIEHDKISLDWLKKIFEKELKQKDVKKHIKYAEEIDEQGFLTRIVFREFQKLSRLYPKEASDELLKETTTFFEKIYEIVSKKTGEKIDPFFYGKFIQMIVIPTVAKEKKGMGIDGHYKFVEHSIRQGYSHIYIIAAGGSNISDGKKLIELLRNDRLLNLNEEYTDIYEGVYKGDKNKILCSLLTKS